jgi:hypothetical protein
VYLFSNVKEILAGAADSTPSRRDRSSAVIPLCAFRRKLYANEIPEIFCAKENL